MNGKARLIAVPEDLLNRSASRPLQLEAGHGAAGPPPQSDRFGQGGGQVNELERSRAVEICQLHEELAGCLRLSVDKAIRIGELLSAQKEELGHGAFIPWVETSLPFDIRSAQRYMSVFRRRLDLKCDSLSYLTEAYARLASRQEVRATAASLREDLHPADPASLVGEKKYRVIYADPPWSYDCERFGNTGDVHRHYPTMSLEDICALPVGEIAEDDAVLFLWVTSPMLMKAGPVIDAWGFEYKTSLVWDKQRHNFGFYVSVRHELLLLATRGSCRPDIAELEDSVVSIERNGHSEKPREFRDLINRLYTHGNRIELFARQAAPDWDAWGNEVPEQAGVHG